jgi:hypothetical protein
LSIHLIHPASAKTAWPNVLWPTLRRARVGVVGEIGRLMHWTGVIAAGLCVLLAIEFLVEGWATHLSRNLLLVSVALTFGARGVRWLLARE